MSNKLSKFFCFIPLVLFIVGTGGYFFTLSTIEGDIVPQGMMPVLMTGLIIMVLSIISNLAVFVWLTVVTCTNADFSGGKKAIWIIGLWILSMFVYPFYWNSYLKNKNEEVE